MIDERQTPISILQKQKQLNIQNTLTSAVNITITVPLTRLAKASATQG